MRPHIKWAVSLVITVGGDGGCRVGEELKEFKLQQLSEIHPLHFQRNFQKFIAFNITSLKDPSFAVVFRCN